MLCAVLLPQSAALAEDALKCKTMWSISETTKYENHRIYFDDKTQEYVYPAEFPEQIREILNSSAMEKMCQLSQAHCPDGSMGPTVAFEGILNILKDTKNASMLQETRGQVYFWADQYHQKYCNQAKPL